MAKRTKSTKTATARAMRVDARRRRPVQSIADHTAAIAAIAAEQAQAVELPPATNSEQAVNEAARQEVPAATKRARRPRAPANPPAEGTPPAAPAPVNTDSAPAPPNTDSELAAMTHPQLFAAYNKLVPAAVAAGVKAKVHTSMFETKAGGIKQITKLQAAIAAAQAVSR